MLGDVRFTMFAWGFDTFFAWGCIFRALCLGMWFSGSCLLGDVDFGTSLLADLLGVDLLGSVRQGCTVRNENGT